MALKTTRIESGPEQGEQWQTASVEPSRAPHAIATMVWDQKE